MRFLNVCVQPLSAESTRNCIITNMDLKTNLPESVMNFILKKMVGVFLFSMEKCARKIRTSPDTSKHGKRMIENADFYQGFLQKKVRLYFVSSLILKSNSKYFCAFIVFSIRMYLFPLDEGGYVLEQSEGGHRTGA